MANIPGTSGPVDYPNRPEGSSDETTGPRLPGGQERYPEPASGDVSAQQGAGSGSGGLYPNPGEAASGSVVKGWKGAAYAAVSPPVRDAVEGLRVAQQQSGEPGMPAGPGIEGGVDQPPGGFKPL